MEVFLTGCIRENDKERFKANKILKEISSLLGNSYHSEIVDGVKRFYLKRKPFEKPVMINEFGVGKNRYLLEDNLHGGLWASSMTIKAGGISSFFLSSKILLSSNPTRIS